jgi:hypothetical protein
VTPGCVVWRQVLGRIESTERFLHVALFQGIPRVDSQLVKARSRGISW